jgi:hypothetical protein
LPAQSDLIGAQRLLSELVRMPESVEKTLELEGRTARFEALERTVNGDAEMPAVRRLDVYANGYFFRILEALQEDYEGLEHALGETHFHNLATAYLLKFPSSATSMRDVGARLPRFLESEPEAEEVRRVWPWAASLARLERAMVEVFDARDAEVASREDFAAVAPERFASLRFELQPSVLRLALDWPVVGIRIAHDQETELALPDCSSPEHALVWRQDERVFYRKLAADEADALERASQGASFGELCVHVAEHVGEESAPGRVAGWLMRWLADGCLVRDPSLAAPE